MKFKYVAPLLWLVVPAASQGSQGLDGYPTVGHSEHHAFYYNLYNTKKGVSCCHDKDCRPTQAQHTNKGWEVKINGSWWTVDSDSILKKAAPDGGAHVCAGDPSDSDPLGRVYCVILPPEI